MIAHVRSLRLASLALALASSVASAADLHLGYSSLEWSAVGESLRGMLRIEVRNVSDSELRNVDVMVAYPGVDAIERSPLQFGSLAAGDARAVVTGFVFSVVKEDPLVWRVQFDQDGVRREIVLVGERQGGVQP